MSFPYSLIDLTHTLDETIPSWGEQCGFQHTIELDYAECTTEVKFRVGQFKMDAGIGTHMDAPAHCNPHGKTIDQIPLSHLVAPCVVIDISSSCHERLSLSVEDIKTFEDVHGSIAPHTFVIVKTGWEEWWENPHKYRNNLIFPSVSKNAAELLLERNVCGLGIDTLSPDRPEDGFPVHKLFLGAGLYIIENIANLDTFPVTGGFIMALPIKAKNATEAPIRLIGLIQH